MSGCIQLGNRLFMSYKIKERSRKQEGTEERITKRELKRET
jgi:hypothetical protein